MSNPNPVSKRTLRAKVAKKGAAAPAEQGEPTTPEPIEQPAPETKTVPQITV